MAGLGGALARTCLFQSTSANRFCEAVAPWWLWDDKNSSKVSTGRQGKRGRGSRTGCGICRSTTPPTAEEIAGLYAQLARSKWLRFQWREREGLVDLTQPIVLALPDFWPFAGKGLLATADMMPKFPSSSSRATYIAYVNSRTFISTTLDDRYYVCEPVDVSPREPANISAWVRHEPCRSSAASTGLSTRLSHTCSGPVGSHPPAGSNSAKKKKKVQEVGGRGGG